MLDTDYVDFSKLFSGNTSCYGEFIPDTTITGESEKAKGKSFTRHAEPTFPLYESHLKGEKSIGIVPIDANGKVRFAAIDVDEYPNKAKFYCAMITRYGFPLVPIQSKSGGLHLYCFFSTDTDAAQAIAAMTSLRQILGLPSTTEIFPKQVTLAEGQVGNWINLPYFNEQNTTRYAYGDEGLPLNLTSFVSLAKTRRVTAKIINEWINNLPLSSAPPCLQTVYLTGAIGDYNSGRNTFLFNAATYIKARYGVDELPFRLMALNSTLPQPLTEDELGHSVLSSQTKGSYSYQCREALLGANCCKELCSKREFGKGSKTISDFSFQDFTQVMTSPPHYRWIVSGVPMVFMSEDELRKQDTFLNLCVRYLHKLPNKLTEARWAEIINTALSKVVIETVEESAVIDEDYEFKLNLYEYIFDRPLADDVEAVERGQVMRSDDHGGYIFKLDYFVKWLSNVKKIKMVKASKFYLSLKSVGCKGGRVYLPKKKMLMRIWILPLSKVMKDRGETTEPAEVGDFSVGTEVHNGMRYTVEVDGKSREVARVPDFEGVKQDNASTRGRLESLLKSIHDAPTVDFEKDDIEF